MKKKIITKIRKSVVANCISWNKDWKKHSPCGIDSREKIGRNIFQFFKCLISIFVFLKNIKSKRVYVFQGLRNKIYCKAFKKNQVVIIGSYKEFFYCKKNGYHFIWSFPIQSSVFLCIYRNINFFLDLVISRWFSRFKSKKITFFVHEDTQPVGSFICFFSRYLSDSKTICIQHATYLRNFHSKPQGYMSKYNFVWHFDQIKFLNFDKNYTFVIGNNYEAKAKMKGNPNIILVGPGNSLANKDLYSYQIKNFIKLSKIIKKNLPLKIIYRPHPEELQTANLLEKLKTDFKIIDTSNKLIALRQARSIFIGYVSSLLYEAKLAGHKTVFIKNKNYKNLSFVPDFNLRIGENTKFIEWVKSVVKNNYVSFLKKTNKANKNKSAKPLFRFVTALKKLEKKYETSH